MFITLEGAEGCGKTTQIEALAAHLRQLGYEVLTTREPGGTPISDRVRSILLDRENTAMRQRTEFLLFQASRAQLVEEVIRPCLAEGGIVLSDRFADSTLAYQGYGYQNDLAMLRSIIGYATGGLKPDLTLLLDLDVEVGLRRRTAGGQLNRLDQYDLAFYRRVRAGYHELVREEPARWEVIDASIPAAQVQEEIRGAVMARLENQPSASPP
jgi:dTMP kinase